MMADCFVMSSSYFLPAGETVLELEGLKLCKIGKLKGKTFVGKGRIYFLRVRMGSRYEFIDSNPFQIVSSSRQIPEQVRQLVRYHSIETCLILADQGLRLLAHYDEAMKIPIRMYCKIY